MFQKRDVDTSNEECSKKGIFPNTADGVVPEPPPKMTPEVLKGGKAYRKYMQDIMWLWRA